MTITQMVLNLVLIAGLGVLTATALLVFPGQVRRWYIGWYGMWGIKIAPDSTLLKDANLRFLGKLGIVAFVFFMIIAFALMYPHLDAGGPDDSRVPPTYDRLPPMPPMEPGPSPFDAPS